LPDLELLRRDVLRASKHLVKLQDEALRLFRPLPHQARIHETTAKRLVIRGGNRSGKTLNAADKLANIVCGNNEHWNRKCPKGGRALVVSLDFSLLSKNCYEKLLEPGAFLVCVNCHRPSFKCRCDEKRFEPAAPLIPHRLVSKIVWLDKGRKIPDRVYLTTGWTIDWRSCESGRAKFQADAWHIAWVDEEGGSDEGVMNEIERGLLENEGWLWWSATPLAAGVKLLEYSERAQEEDAERKTEGATGDPRHEEVILLTDDNVTLPRDEVAAFFEGMSEEEEQVRRTGEFLVQQGLVYREWDKRLHLVEPYGIPEDWTIYDILDPGHANAFAILFLAVKPDGDWVVFDEIYAARMDIPEIVQLWRGKLAGKSVAFQNRPHWAQITAIDPASKQVHQGMKKMSVRQQIHMEREKHKFRSYNGGFKTYCAPNSRMAGIFAVKSLLTPRTNIETTDPRYGTPKLTVFKTCYHFQREVKRYRYPRAPEGKSVNEVQGPIKKDDHLMDCIRMAALMNFEFVPMHTRPHWGRGVPEDGPFRKLWKRKRKRAFERSRQATNCT
jgi:hypothetical protein